MEKINDNGEGKIKKINQKKEKYFSFCTEPYEQIDRNVLCSVPVIHEFYNSIYKSNSSDFEENKRRDGHFKKKQECLANVQI